MKKISALLALMSAAFLLQTAFAEVPALFEGVVEAAGVGPGMTNSATIYLKGKKAKILPKEAIGGTNGYPILNMETMKISMIATTEKYWMEMPIEAVVKSIEAGTVNLKASGKKDTLLGHPAEEWVGKDNEKKVEVHIWGTPDAKPGVNFFTGFARMSDDGLVIARAGQEMIAKGLCPLKVTATKEGKSVFVWEISKMEAKTVADSTFDVPAGFIRYSEFIKKQTKTTRGR